LDKTTKEPTEGKEVNGEGILLDRNTLLKEILANSSKN
jgi:hypothetical protein